jgi:hypothetical protein
MAIVVGPRLGVIRSATEGENWFPEVDNLHRLIDALIMGAVADKDLDTPPVSPADGDMYIVAATATGDWTGHEKDLAYWDDTAAAWFFYTPLEGFSVRVNDENLTYVYDGSAWGPFAPGGAPTGAAGGSLGGTYPNPGIASSVALPGNPTTTTQSPGDNSTKISTTAYADAAAAAALTAVRNGVGAAFDTLAEVATELALKAPSTGIAGAALINNLRDVLPPFVLDGGGAVVTTGTKIYGIVMPCSGTLVGWEVLTDLAATVTLDIKAADYATWPTTASIFSTKPFTTAARKGQASGLAIAVTAGDVWEVTVDANDLAKWISLNPHIRRS